MASSKDNNSPIIKDKPPVFTYFLRVIVPAPFYDLVYYGSSEPIVPGTRVLVPWHKRELVAVVIEAVTESDFPINRLKPIIEVLPEVFSSDQQRQQWLNLLLWCINYYHAAPGDVLTSTVPRRFLQPKGQLDEPVSATGQEPLLKEQPKELNQQQQEAVDQILGHRWFYLLEGITGSGKTEVYLQLACRYLQMGKQVLVLVPEIGLIPQIGQQFRQRFNIDISLYHSGLTDKQRMQTWVKSCSTEPQVIIGTRSAVFLPLANLAMVIIDEEHDLSYRQQSGFYYHARDVAAMRAQQQQLNLLMSSATPSLESIHNCNLGKYHHLRLTKRVGNTQLPEWQMIDLLGTKREAGISQALLLKINQSLKKGKQVMLFLNKRGYAPTLHCQDCNWIAECRSCSVKMVFHSKPKRIILCHQCGYRRPEPHHCDVCRSSRLERVGQGTQRLEDYLQARFPDTPLLRIDRDNVRRKGDIERMINEINRGLPCIMLGTQMLSKGHHFPNMSLVAILNIDYGLFSCDFRSLERLAQLVTQVAGRSGRGEQGGTAVLQSYYIDHPWLKNLLHRGYSETARKLLQQRESAQLPPFTYMALIHSSSTQLDFALQQLQQLSLEQEGVAQQLQVTMIGPMPALIEQRNRRYRFQLQAIATHRPQLHRWIQATQTYLRQQKQPQHWRWSIEIDPQSMD